MRKIPILNSWEQETETGPVRQELKVAVGRKLLQKARNARESISCFLLSEHLCPNTDWDGDSNW